MLCLSVDRVEARDGKEEGLTERGGSNGWWLLRMRLVQPYLQRFCVLEFTAIMNRISSWCFCHFCPHGVIIVFVGAAASVAHGRSCCPMVLGGALEKRSETERVG